MNDDGQRVDAFLIDQHVEAHKLCGLKSFEVIIERRKTPTDRFKSIEEVENDLGEFDDAREVVTAVMAEYKAAESPEFADGGDDDEE